MLLCLARAIVLGAGFCSALCFGLWLQIVIFNGWTSSRVRGDCLRGSGEWEHCQGVGSTLVAWWWRCRNSLRKDQAHIWTVNDHHSKSMELYKLVLKIEYMLSAFLNKGLGTEPSSINNKALEQIVAQVSTAPCLIQQLFVAMWSVWELL